MLNDPQKEQALLQQLRASSAPSASQEAAQLEPLFHDRQMGRLAADVYDAANGPGDNAGKPPAGWMRVSDDPGKYASQLHMTKEELMDQLHPDKSGFRAEIYIPDPKILGPGYKPVLAFKGSSGDVRTADGKLHDTTKEDFLANNFPQSVGMQTDYYDRAMRLASMLKQRGLDFELTGHSLSGGMAAAAAAVTGNRATTWNAAGLNPETARRFGEQNHLPIYNNEQLKPLVTAYQVQGELLSDGVQGNIHRFDVIQRAEVGGLMKEASQLLKALPQGRELLAQQMGKDMPAEAQATVHAFVDKLATGDIDQMLRDLPLAAGTVQAPLVAITQKDPTDPASPLVVRAQTLSLQQVTTLAAPILETLSIAALGAHVGERGGTLVADGGQGTGQVLHASGTGVRGVADYAGDVQRATTRINGLVAQTAEHYLGEAAARINDFHSKMLAGAHEGLGWAQQGGASVDAGLLRGVGRMLPESGQQWMNGQAACLDRSGQESRQATQARADEIRHEGDLRGSAIREATQSLVAEAGWVATQVGDVQHDVIAGSGRVVGGTLDATGQIVESATRQAPALGAAIGGAIGTGAGLALELRSGNFPRLLGAARAIEHGGPAASQAFEEHLMTTSVLPSLDARIGALEKAAHHTVARAGAPATLSGIDQRAEHALPEQASSHAASLPTSEPHRSQPVSDTDRVIADMHQAVLNHDSHALNAASETFLRSPTGQVMGQQIELHTQSLQEQAARGAQQQSAQQQGATQQSQGMGR